MEGTLKWSAIAAIAPITWGANYVVVHQLLPADSPLWGSALRALPAGLILLALAHRLPRGQWWWRSAVLGVLNVGAFFVLVYVAAELLPSSVASTIMACSPIAMMVLAWAMLGERPLARMAAGGLMGLAGVALLVLSGTVAVNPWGVVASATAMAMSATGFTLTKKWASDIPPLTMTAWQLLAGGAVLLLAALVVEGAPPAYDAQGWIGIAYTSLIATGAAYVAWFAALRRLPTGTVGLIGLLNPLTGVALGLAISGEHLTVRQILGVGAVIGGILLGQRVRRARREPGAVPAAKVATVADRHPREAGACTATR